MFSRWNPSSSAARGFTLIELMITVAIVGILAAIALPAYTNAVLKGKRGEGRAALTDFLQQQERFFTQNNIYMEVTSASVGVPFKTFSADTLANSAYTLTAEACSGETLRTCLKVSAAPVKAGSDPEVGTLWILSTGKRGCDGSKPTACWK